MSNEKSSQPRCPFCNREWNEKKSLIPSQQYCSQCRAARRKLAGLLFRNLKPSVVQGKYLLPRHKL